MKRKCGCCPYFYEGGYEYQDDWSCELFGQEIPYQLEVEIDGEMGCCLTLREIKKLMSLREKACKAKRDEIIYMGKLTNKYRRIVK